MGMLTCIGKLVTALYFLLYLNSIKLASVLLSVSFLGFSLKHKTVSNAI